MDKNIELSTLEFRVNELEHRIEHLESILIHRQDLLGESVEPQYRKCPKCGSDLEVDTMFVLACYPAKYQVGCRNKDCDYRDTVGKNDLGRIRYRREM